MCCVVLLCVGESFCTCMFELMQGIVSTIKNTLALMQLKRANRIKLVCNEHRWHSMRNEVSLITEIDNICLTYLKLKLCDIMFILDF